MRISTKGRYAVLAILDLATHSQTHPVPLPTIALRQGLSQHYLEQLFVKMRRASLVKSTRGPGGGYTLAKPPGRVTIRDVLRAVGEEIRPVVQVEDGEKSSEASARLADCIGRLLWGRLARQIEETLSSITLEDLLKEHQSLSTKRPVTHKYEVVI